MARPERDALTVRAGVWRRILAAVFLLAAAPAFADEVQVLQGTHDDAPYRIDMPAHWNGGLVMFVHGYGGEGTARGGVEYPRIGDVALKGNYAWAGSGYRSQGYHPDLFLADTIALREMFIARFGTPRWTILYGESMGGHMVVAGLERHPDLFQAGLAECGVVDGVGLIDWYYAYTAAAQYFSGVPLLDATAADYDRRVAEFVARIGKPGAYTERGRRFDSAVRALAGGDMPAWGDGMAKHYLEDLWPRVPLPRQSAEFARHADTRGIVYGIAPGLGVDAATLNRDIPRIVPAAGARTGIFAPFTGRLRGPLMTLHDTADLDVPVRMAQNYRRRTLAAGTSALLVQRTQTRSDHCDFSQPLRDETFTDLVAWLERGIVPKGEDLLGDVTKLGFR